MIGEGKLTEQEARQRVNGEIEKKNLREEQTKDKDSTKNEKQIEIEQEEANQGEERTPWGDAMRRSKKF